MFKILAICATLILTCCGMHGGIMRDLQHEIDIINIELTDGRCTTLEREFLRGKSAGIFIAMEILNEQGVW